MIIAVDFDGTIVQSSFPDIGMEIPGALVTLTDFQSSGHQIILWTCRSKRHLADAVQWLADRDFIQDAVNQQFNLPGMYGLGKNCKIYADIYIDDRNIETKAVGVNWKKIKQQVLIIENQNQ
jgi:hypothetical protein